MTLNSTVSLCVHPDNQINKKLFTFLLHFYFLYSIYHDNYTYSL